MKTKQNISLRLALVAAACAALAGCADFSGIQSESKLRDAASVGLDAKAAPPVAVIEAKWWQAYGDQQLDQLIEQAEHLWRLWFGWFRRRRRRVSVSDSFSAAANDLVLLLGLLARCLFRLRDLLLDRSQIGIQASV